MASSFLIMKPDVPDAALTVTVTAPCVFDQDYPLAGAFNGFGYNYARLKDPQSLLEIVFDLGTGNSRAADHFIIGGVKTLVAIGVDNVLLQASTDNSTWVDQLGTSPWSALGTGMNAQVLALTADSSGNLYAGGIFTTAGGTTVNYIAKWNGASWSVLGTGMNGQVNALALDSSGNLYAGGSFTTAGGTTVNRIAKWNGTSWSALGTGMNDQVLALTVDSSGNLYAGGFFTTAGGTTVNHIAKWNGASWSVLGTGMTSSVNALALDSSGNLYAGGTFFTAGGTAANRIAKWNGTSWSALGTGMNHQVDALTVDSSGNLYAGGYFTTAGGTTVNRIAKWNGTSWSALGTGMSGTVSELTLDSSGNLYVGGFFTTAGGTTVNRIAKWNGTSWSALAGMTSGVTALTLDSSGNLYVGGNFTTAGGKTVNRIAKWTGSSFLSKTFNGPNTDIIIFTTTYNSDVTMVPGSYRYFKVIIEKTTGGVTIPFSFSKLYFGAAFDMGKEPDNYNIDVLDEGSDTWKYPRGHTIVSKSFYPKNSVTIEWDGVTDSKTNEFFTAILNDPYRSTVYLYTQQYKDPLFDNTIMFCKVMSQDSSITKDNDTAGWNDITAVFEEAE